MQSTTTRPLYDVAREIRRLWRPVNFAAKPWLAAMAQLDTVNDAYGAESGKAVIAYFLSNAAGWRGEDAKRIKAELKAALAAK
jgi:hypothetical protein